MSTTRNTIFGLAAVLLLGAGWWLLEEPPAAATERRATVRLEWPVGSAQRYALLVDSTVVVDGAARHAYRLAAELQLQVFGRRGDQVQLGCQLSNIEQKVDGEARSEPGLGSFFVVDVTAAGRFESFDFPKGVDRMTRERLQNTLRMFQVVVPADADGSWTTRERDAHGECTVIYRHAGGTRIKRARVEYAAGDTRILTSSGSAELAASGRAWLDSVAIREEQQVTTETGQRVDVDATASLRRIEGARAWTGSTVSRLAASAKKVAAAEQQAVVAKQRPATAADRRKLHDLIATLDRTGELGDFLIDLSALLTECPELAATIPARLLRGDLKDLTVSALIHGLRLTGHGVAQGALLSIARDPNQGRRDQVRAIIDLGGVEEPDDDTLKGLWELTLLEPGSEAANTALLALGRAGNSLRDRENPRYASLRGQLVQALQFAAKPTDRVTALTAVGNTRDATLVETVATHLAAETSQERGAAAKALGRLPGGRDALLGTLRHEASPFVRAKVVEGLVAHGAPTAKSLAAIDRVIAAESNDRTRMAMARYLGENLAEFPSARQTLEELLTRETNNSIRKYVAGRVYAK